jgi:hypothetical protein
MTDGFGCAHNDFDVVRPQGRPKIAGETGRFDGRIVHRKGYQLLNGNYASNLFIWFGACYYQLSDLQIEVIVELQKFVGGELC